MNKRPWKNFRNIDRAVTIVEHLDAIKARPFRIVEHVVGLGFSRQEAIEIYRAGTMSWQKEKGGEYEYNASI